MDFNSEILFNILNGAFCVLLCLVVFFVIKLKKLNSDLTTLKYLLRQIARKEVRSEETNSRLQSRKVQEIWRLLWALFSQNSNRSQQNPNVDEVLTLSSQIAGASDEVSSASAAVIKLLHQQIGSELVSVAIVLRDERDGFYLEEISGLPKERLEIPLLMLFEHLAESGNKAGFGYLLPESNQIYNFSAFGVGLTLCLPLSNNLHSSGGLWLGFKTGSSLLSTSKKNFIQALATHAASSFYAATKVRKRSAEDKRERDFLLGISHDLRSPSNSALYALRDLLSSTETNLNKDQKQTLKMVEQSLEDQLTILGDVLDYAKHQKGFLSAEIKPVDLSELVPKTLDSYKLIAERKGLQLTVNAIPSEFSLMDPKHFQRMLGNLISNAIKYTETGTITVNVESDLKNITIKVSDSGIGVPKDEEDLLFKEFSRLANGKGIQGVGLGLVLTRAIAELNNAQVSYHPNPTGGSIFSITMPRAPIDSVAPEETTLPLLNSILVVDDDHAACRTNIRYLREVGSSLIPANSCKNARRLAYDLRPDLIVSDLNLGDGSILSLVNDLQNDNIMIPILIITGSGSIPDLETLSKNFLIKVLEKPAGRDDLVSAVNALVNTHSKFSFTTQAETQIS